MGKDYYGNSYSEHQVERSYMRNLPYDCGNCGYMGRPSSAGAVCSTCVLKKNSSKKSKSVPGA